MATTTHNRQRGSRSQQSRKEAVKIFFKSFQGRILQEAQFQLAQRQESLRKETASKTWRTCNKSSTATQAQINSANNTISISLFHAVDLSPTQRQQVEQLSVASAQSKMTAKHSTPTQMELLPDPIISIPLRLKLKNNEKR